MPWHPKQKENNFTQASIPNMTSESRLFVLIANKNLQVDPWKSVPAFLNRLFCHEGTGRSAAAELEHALQDPFSVLNSTHMLLHGILKVASSFQVFTSSFWMITPRSFKITLTWYTISPIVFQMASLSKNYFCNTKKRILIFKGGCACFTFVSKKIIGFIFQVL